MNDILQISISASSVFGLDRRTSSLFIGQSSIGASFQRHERVFSFVDLSNRRFHICVYCTGVLGHTSACAKVSALRVGFLQSGVRLLLPSLESLPSHSFISHYDITTITGLLSLINLITSAMFNVCTCEKCSEPNQQKRSRHGGQKQPHDVVMAASPRRLQHLSILYTTDKQQNSKNIQQRVFASGHPPNY